MVDEERLFLMTRMASFEENEGKKTIPICEFFRSDYVGLHILLSVVYITVAYALVTAVYLFCGMESFLSNFYRTDFISFGKELLQKYVIVLGVYILIAFLVYSYRYTVAKKSTRTYQKALKRLSSMYDKKTK